MDLLRDTQQGGILSANLPGDVEAVARRGEEEQHALGFLALGGLAKRREGGNGAGKHAESHDLEGFPAIDGLIDVHGRFLFTKIVCPDGREITDNC